MADVVQPDRRAGRMRVERIMWGALIVWFGVAWLFDSRLPEGLGPFVAGAIVLAGVGYLRARKLGAGVVMWVVGWVLVALGVFDLTGLSDINWFAVALIVCGGWILLGVFGLRRTR